MVAVLSTDDGVCMQTGCSLQKKQKKISLEFAKRYPTKNKIEEVILHQCRLSSIAYLIAYSSPIMTLYIVVSCDILVESEYFVRVLPAMC